METEEQPEVEKTEKEEAENCLQEYPPMDEKLVNLGELG